MQRLVFYVWEGVDLACEEGGGGGGGSDLCRRLSCVATHKLTMAPRFLFFKIVGGEIVSVIDTHLLNGSFNPHAPISTPLPPSCCPVWHLDFSRHLRDTVHNRPAMTWSRLVAGPPTSFHTCYLSARCYHLRLCSPPFHVTALGLSLWELLCHHPRPLTPHPPTHTL